MYFSLKNIQNKIDSGRIQDCGLRKRNSKMVQTKRPIAHDHGEMSSKVGNLNCLRMG